MVKLSKINTLSDLIEFGNVDASSPSSCWLWEKTLFVNGYGRVGGERAHRKAWELSYGAVPDGMLVLHHCDVRSCLNPMHLFVGTQLDNMHDMIEKGRKVVPSGDDHHMKRENLRAAMSGDNHWSKRLPERVASGDRHWSKKHPEDFARVAFTGSAKKKVSE